MSSGIIAWGLGGTGLGIGLIWSGILVINMIRDGDERANLVTTPSMPPAPPGNPPTPPPPSPPPPTPPARRLLSQFHNDLMDLEPELSEALPEPKPKPRPIPRSAPPLR